MNYVSHGYLLWCHKVTQLNWQGVLEAVLQTLGFLTFEIFYMCKKLYDTLKEGKKKTEKVHYVSFSAHFMCASSVLPHLWDGNRIRAWEVLLKSYRVGWCPGVSSHLNCNDAAGEESVCLSGHVPHHHWELVTDAHLRVQSGRSWWSQRDRWHIIVCSVLFYDMILFVCNVHKS